MEDTRPALGRRIAALLAIAGLIGAILAVAFAVINTEAWRIALALVVVAAAVVGLWYLVSRRGIVSVMGAVIAAGSLAALFVLVLSAYDA